MTTTHIEAILERLRPAIAADGGEIEFVSYEAGVVSVRLKGACVGCPMSVYTLQLGVLEHLRAELPEIKKVVAVE